MERGRFLRIAVGAALALLLLAWYFDDPLRTTPGFFIDESSIATNALLISRTGADEHGVRMPLYFAAFGEYKNPVYIYLLAAVFRVTGPGILIARTLSIVLGFAAAIVMALLFRRDLIAASFVFLAALMTPWLFETSRLVFEVAAFPLALALALLAARKGSIVPCALALALVTYTYTAGRLLGPLMAIGLLLLLPWRRVLAIWGAYAIALIPLLVFAIRHPGALTARLAEVGVTRNFMANYFASFSILWRGDPNARHHIPFGGEIFISLAILAVIGLIAGWRDRWGRYLLFLLLIAPLPGAITNEGPHALRLITMAVAIVILAGHGMQRVLQWRKPLAAVFFIALVAEGMIFRYEFEKLGPLRISEFDVTYPYVLDAALATRAPVGVEDSPYYIHAWWYSGARLPIYRRGTEPNGTVMVGTAHDCPTCRVLVNYRGFVAYVRDAPR